MNVHRRQLWWKSLWLSLPGFYERKTLVRVEINEKSITEIPILKFCALPQYNNLGTFYALIESNF